MLRILRNPREKASHFIEPQKFTVRLHLKCCAQLCRSCQEQYSETSRDSEEKESTAIDMEKLQQRNKKIDH